MQVYILYTDVHNAGNDFEVYDDRDVAFATGRTFIRDWLDSEPADMREDEIVSLLDDFTTSGYFYFDDEFEIHVIERQLHRS